MNFKLEELTKDNEAQYLGQVANLEQVVMENMEAKRPKRSAFSNRQRRYFCICTF